MAYKIDLISRRDGEPLGKWWWWCLGGGGGGGKYKTNRLEKIVHKGNAIRTFRLKSRKTPATRSSGKVIVKAKNPAITFLVVCS